MLSVFYFLTTHPCVPNWPYSHSSLVKIVKALNPRDGEQSHKNSKEFDPCIHFMQTSRHHALSCFVYLFRSSTCLASNNHRSVVRTVHPPGPVASTFRQKPLGRTQVSFGLVHPESPKSMEVGTGSRPMVHGGLRELRHVSLIPPGCCPAPHLVTPQDVVAINPKIRTCHIMMY